MRQKFTRNALSAGLLALCLFGCGRGDVVGGAATSKPAPAAASGGGGRVVMFGIDGADWQVIRPLVEAGRLPNFKRIIEGGATGVLMSMEPSASPSLWTTIATGVGPGRHGIEGFVVGPDAAHGDEAGGDRAAPAGAAAAGKRPDVRPVTSTMRKAPAFWNILPAYDRKVGVVGWLVTWPAEPTNGYIVSSYLPYIYNWSTGRPLKGTIVSGIPHQTFPEALIEELEKEKVKPEQITRDTLSRFYDPARIPALPAADRECVEGFVWSLACDETYRRVGLRLFDQYPVDLFAVYFGGVDVASHRFWKFAHPDALPYGVGRDEAAVLGGVIDAYYGYIDGLLGEYLGRLGDDATLVVLSDHGFKPAIFPGKPQTSGHHRHEGVIALYGRGIRRGARIEGAGLLDVLPTLLRLLDVPLARSLEGRPLEDALQPEFARAHPVQRTGAYNWDGKTGGPDPSELDRNVLERLRSLGYIN